MILLMDPRLLLLSHLWLQDVTHLCQSQLITSDRLSLCTPASMTTLLENCGHHPCHISSHSLL